MKKPSPQNKRILLYMCNDLHTLCSLDAPAKVRIASFTKRIDEIRDEGWPVDFIEDESKMKHWNLKKELMTAEMWALLDRVPPEPKTRDMFGGSYQVGRK